MTGGVVPTMHAGASPDELDRVASHLGTPSPIRELLACNARRGAASFEQTARDRVRSRNKHHGQENEPRSVSMPDDCVRLCRQSRPLQLRRELLLQRGKHVHEGLWLRKSEVASSERSRRLHQIITDPIGDDLSPR